MHAIELCIIFNIIISLWLAPAIAIHLSNRYATPIRKPFLLGCLTYLVSQVFLCLPFFSKILPKMPFYTFYEENPLFLAILVALFSALLEEPLTLFLLKYSDHSYSTKQSIVFGLGRSFVCSFLYVGKDALLYLKDAIQTKDLSGVDTFVFLENGILQIFLCLFHIGILFLLQKGICSKQIFSCFFWALLFHIGFVFLLACYKIFVPSMSAFFWLIVLFSIWAFYRNYKEMKLLQKNKPLALHHADSDSNEKWIKDQQLKLQNESSDDLVFLSLENLPKKPKDSVDVFHINLSSAASSKVTEDNVDSVSFSTDSKHSVF